MNIINSLNQDNQETLKEALALLVKQGGREKVAALRSQLEGNTPLVVKEDVRDWMCGEAPEDVAPADKAVFQMEADLNSQQPRIAFYQNGHLAGELSIEINKGTPAVHINTTEDSSLAHIHFAQGGIVITTDNPSVTPEPAERDRHAYYQSSTLIRHERNDELLAQASDDAFAAYDFGLEVFDSSAWRQEDALHWVKTVRCEKDDGAEVPIIFHVRFDERYESVIAEAYALALATGSEI